MNEAFDRGGFNTKLGVVYRLDGGPTTIGIETMVKEKRRGARATRIVASHCPFCGIAYESGAPEPEAAP
jgi:hypothetical protein